MLIREELFKNPEETRKATRVGANSSSVFAFEMHYK